MTPGDMIRAGQVDDRGTVFRATIDSPDPRMRMWAFRAYFDCGLEYVEGPSKPASSEMVVELERNATLDPIRKAAVMQQLARLGERCKGFANLTVKHADMIALLRRAAEEGALSAQAALHLKHGGARDSPQKAAIAARPSS